MPQDLPTIEELMETGAHFGHIRKRWHPKMSPYIFGIRNNVHIINLEKTRECLAKAIDFVGRLIDEKKTILFVGTKRQAKEAIKKTAGELNMPYIDFRWLGGTLTNFETVAKATNKLKILERQSEDKEFFAKMTKKERKNFLVELDKMDKTLSGIKEMKSLPDALFIIDTIEEKVAVAEAIKLEIPIIAIIDSNSDPSQIAYPIPANDDSKLAIDLIMETIVKGVKKLKIETVGKKADDKEIKSHKKKMEEK